MSKQNTLVFAVRLTLLAACQSLPEQMSMAAIMSLTVKLTDVFCCSPYTYKPHLQLTFSKQHPGADHLEKILKEGFPGGNEAAALLWHVAALLGSKGQTVCPTAR